MKKALLLSVLAAATVFCADAQGRRWDFTNWSAATVNNLKAGSDWSDIEKVGATEPTAISKDNCFWEVTYSGTAEGVTLTANGTAIAELEGLLYVNTTDRSLAIAVNYGDATSVSGDGFGPYHGSSYLWFGGSKKNYFVIPNVEPGTEITIGEESHKYTDTAGRGVQLFIYQNNTKGTQLKDIDGNEVGVPIDTYEEFTWYVPTEGLTETPNEDGTYNVLIYNTNGCHLYYIQVGSGQQSLDEVTAAYVYDGTYTYCGIDNDPIYNNVVMNYVSTAIDVSTLGEMTTEELNDSLTKFDVVVLAEAIGSGNAYAKAMLDIVNKVPMLNLKSFMYKSGVWSWGAGSNPSPKANTIVVDSAYREDPLFDGVVMEDDGSVALFYIGADDITSGNLVQGWTASAGSLIADDEVIATVSGINAIHKHGTRNVYMLIPISSDNMCIEGESTLSDDAYTLLQNAITTLAATKSKVTPAAAPVIATKEENLVTTVTITCATAGSKIYYTTDGTDPTEASTLYTEPFQITVDSTVVKAFATAQGYEPSGISSSVIAVKGKLAEPTISVSGATVTISADAGDIYYNIVGSTSTTVSQKYDGPFTAPFSCDVTAFAASDDMLPSEAVVAAVITDNPYNELIDHITFDPANGWGDYTGSKKLMGATNACATEPTDSTLVTGKASDGVTDSTYYEYVYAPLDSLPEFTLASEKEGWTVTTHGQQLYIIKDYNNALGYEGGPTAYGFANVFTAKEYTRWAIGFQNIKHVREEGVANAFLYSNKTYKAPFELAVNITHVVGSGTNQTLYAVEPGQEASGLNLVAKFELSTSIDGETWTPIDTLTTTCNKMAERVATVVEGTDEVYLKIRSLRPDNLVSSSNQKANIYDIIIKGAGEFQTGIESLAADKAVEPASDVTYDILGRRVTTLVPGQLYIRGGKKIIVK